MLALQAPSRNAKSSMQRHRTQRAFSAGGVVFRRGQAASSASGSSPTPSPDNGTEDIEVVLVGRSSSGIWALPKGTPRKGETVEQVALREVSEETGLKTRILGSIGSIHYSFVRNNLRYEKDVRYFLMEQLAETSHSTTPNMMKSAGSPCA